MSNAEKQLILQVKQVDCVRMKIALIGYGKMGHIIEQTALQRGHKIVAIIDVANIGDISSDAFRSAEAAVEFTTPATAQDNILAAWRQGVPVVSGTTGWDINLLKQQFPQPQQSLLWSSNFSIGVNIMFALNKRLAELIKPYPQYTPSIEEVHHIHKLDAPSGTAKTLALEIERQSGITPPIESIREGEVPGIHTVTYDSNVDTITLRHEAKSRAGFALGAVIAAEWITKQPTGYYRFEELME